MTIARPDFDRHMMAIALAMARRALGTTAPNPAVGAVIADEASGVVVARGWTQPGGRPHAEQHALTVAGERARGCTMYVTLEPCACTGRVPTCSDAIVGAGITRVVSAITDPNPVIAGRGINQLRAAEIEVALGLGGEEAHWLTLGHILRQVASRPFVRLKMALDASLSVASGNGRPVWVTGPEARALAHRLRADVDAIVVGSGTVLADDPELTCRLPGMGDRSPRRVVLDGRMRVQSSARLLVGPSGSETWIATRASAEGFQRRHGSGARRLAIDPGLEEGDSRALVGILLVLAQQGITRLLVEGGPAVWQAFLDAGLVDEAVVIVSAERATGQAIPVLDGDIVSALRPYGLELAATGEIGRDSVHTLRRTQG